jgi:hypothetical protein
MAKPKIVEINIPKVSSGDEKARAIRDAGRVREIEYFLSLDPRDQERTPDPRKF